MQNARNPYVLGLDLGVQSIGWAIVEVDSQGDPIGLSRTGVRCFESGVGTESDIEQGKDASRNVARRQARQQRRQAWRRARRSTKTFRILQEAGLLPADGGCQPGERHQAILALDRQLAADYLASGDRIAAHLLPYRLRAIALDSALAPYALGRALYHLAQRRGYLSNRKARRDEKEEGKVKQGIEDLEAEMAASGARTLGEYFAGLDPEAERQRIRKRWTAREMYKAEFEAICDAQAEHHAVLKGAFRDKLRTAIFYQRPLKSQKGLIGRCYLEAGEPRAPVALLDAQRFRYLQRLNDLLVECPDGSSRPLAAEERERLRGLLEETADVTFAGMRKALKDKKSGKCAEEYVFNLERGGEKKLPGNRTNARLTKSLGDDWLNLSAEQRDQLVVDLVEYENREALANRLAARYGLSGSIAAEAAKLTLEPGYFALSKKAIGRLLPLMERGMPFATARKEMYGDQLAASAVHEKLPSVLAVNPDLRNPVVCRALTELRKVVNAIVREHGKPLLVRIELARDMKRSRKQRDEIWKEHRQNEKRREEAKRKILQELGESDPRPGDVLKVLLAEECGWKCPYTGRPISMSTLIGKSPQFDIEHIIPFSRSLDNSFANKTLCYHEENRNRKQNRTPHEAYAGDATRYDEILARVASFIGPQRHVKQQRFRLEAIPDDFVERQLNDTRYISRLAGNYVGLLFGGQIDREGRRRIQVSPGRMTAYLREAWDLDSILAGDQVADSIPHDAREGAKNRDDHRHHAVDAVVIALTEAKTVQNLTRAAERAADLGRRLLVRADDPWPSFREALARSIGEIRVSYRVDHRVSGALHKDTNHSPPRTEKDDRGRPRTYCVIRKPLASMSKDEIAKIVDPVIRQLVQEKIGQLGGDPKKAFADEANHPYLKARDGRLIPIHKARIRKSDATVAVGSKGAPRYVAPGSNHHMEIVAVLDDQGREIRWEAKTVSLLEAHRRLQLGEPVVQRDHGAKRRFKFSLTGSDYIELDDDNEVRRLYRIAVISGGKVEFRLHTDARASTVLRNIQGGRAGLTKAADALRKANARKVAIDPLGNVTAARD